MKMIPKAENTFKHKYDQAESLSITTRDYIADNTNTEIRRWGFDVRSLKQRSEVKKVRGIGTSWSQPRRLIWEDKEQSNS